MSSEPSFFDRTLANLRSAWDSISISRNGDKLKLSPDLPEEEQESLREHIRACLAGKGGEVSARGRAAELGEAYLDLSDIGKLNFFKLLAGEFGIDHDALDEAISGYSVDELSTAERLLAETRLRQLLRPRYMILLTQFNALPQGVKFLVDLRADLLRLRGDDATLAALDEDLRRQLESWFDIGFLELRQITWDAPAALLERLIHYEAVHAINSWDELKKRLAPDRRCFAFFHPRMPDEPLIFVWVALVPEMSGNVQSLLDLEQSPQDVAEATNAIFYSISNTQVGLQGVSLGNFLIKRVAKDLLAELPDLKTFATLSPIPGFSRWLKRSASEDESLLDSDTSELLASPDWHLDEEKTAQLEKALKPLCARYLVNEKRGQRALDPVAHFHLSNGALIERINWLGDTAPKGLANSHGLMVNYLYKLGEIDRHHELYSESFEVSTSRDVRGLADKG